MLFIHSFIFKGKSGVVPEKCNELCVYISENCPHLKLRGLMTIGEPEHGERDFNVPFSFF